MRRHGGRQRAGVRHLDHAASDRGTPRAGLQVVADLEVRRRIALVEQHQRNLADAALLVDAIERGAIALQQQVQLQAALQGLGGGAHAGDALEVLADRVADRRVHARLAEVITVAGMLGGAAHEAGFRAVVDHRDAGVTLEDGYVQPDALAYPDPKNKHIIGIEIHSGRNRIVRRIFEHLGYDVRNLDRVMYANLTKKNVDRGKWRFLSEKEVRLLKFLNASYMRK